MTVLISINIKALPLAKSHVEKDYDKTGFING